MNSSMFHFKNFVSSSHEGLNDGELKFASLVLNNFSEIEKKGTAAGSRARYVSSIYTSNTFVPAVKEPLTVIDDSSRLVKLSSIEIEGFRGFTGKETFDLSKKYNFLYGPNGSGKSSFCEALELSLTGKISEAESKNFTVKKYIKNMYSSNSSVLLKVEDTQGEVAPLANAQTENDFMFIERNRIEGFARVSSYTAGAQQQRLSMLFGLERFTNFCNGFSDSISNYIDAKSPVYDKNKELALRLEALGSNKKIKIGEQNGLNENKTILLMRYPNCKLASELITYLSPENGLIKKKQDEFYKYKNIKLKNLTPLDTLLKDLSSIADFLVAYERLTKEINASSSQVVFINLYESIQAIERLEDISNNSCPACDTPLIDVKSNPFQKSKEQLLLLKELARKQKSQSELQRNIENYSTSCNQGLKGIGLTSLIDSTLHQTSEGSCFLNASISLSNAYEATIAKRQGLELENSKNAPLMAEIDNLQRELKVLHDDLAETNQLTALFRKNHSDLKIIDKEVEQTKAAIFTLVGPLKLEQQQLEKNQQFITDYASFVRKLKLYNLELPSVLSQSLSNTVLELYNLINKHPYDHEVLVSLSLPKNANEKIEIEFNDGSKDDALRILSEGHLRCLGLSILLAKNIHDKHNIIVFDDVVNAIDDEHRSGVLDAIFNYPKLLEKQYVITTHGEDFLKRLENLIPSKLVKSKLNRYDFKRNIAHRTILVSSDDFRQYLVKAETALFDGKIKDSLMESRRSLEGLANLLWKHIGKQNLDSSVSVQLRSPNAHPDLYGIISGLIKSLKSFEKTPGIDTYKPIKDILAKIQANSTRHKENWQLLNKGTHEEDRDEEFDEVQAKELIDLLVILESEILNYKKPNQIAA
ncbi:hypothetical protein [Shewanella sp. 10N.286.54.B9]|uniref:hypothetical protein n=1 Tax=Shewanella sp. 10N.286.54.B9 TaxID=3229719 RepID=UPI00354B3171